MTVDLSQGDPVSRYMALLPRRADDPVAGYRAPVVTKVAGISYRQLDYWSTTGLLRPSVRDAEGSGTQRLFSFDDVVRARVVSVLTRAGVSLQMVRRIMGVLDVHSSRPVVWKSKLGVGIRVDIPAIRSEVRLALVGKAAERVAA